MNDIQDITVSLEALLPRHHVVLVENGFPYRLTFSAIGPKVDPAYGLWKAMQTASGASNLRLYVSDPDYNGDLYITNIEVNA